MVLWFYDFFNAPSPELALWDIKFSKLLSCTFQLMPPQTSSFPQHPLLQGLPCCAAPVWRLCHFHKAHMTSGHGVTHCLSPGRKRRAPSLAAWCVLCLWCRGCLQCAVSVPTPGSTGKESTVHGSWEDKKHWFVSNSQDGHEGDVQLPNSSLLLKPPLWMCTPSQPVPASLVPSRWVSPVWCLATQRPLLPLLPAALLDVLAPPGPTISYSSTHVVTDCLGQPHGKQGLQF